MSETINLNDLLKKEGIDPKSVIVMRHRPYEPELRKVLPWLASDKPHIYNAYQSAHFERAERALLRAEYVASFIGHEAGKALFIGLYEIKGNKPITYEEFYKMKDNQELMRHGMTGLQDKDACRLWFDLRCTDFYKDWKGKMVVSWPGGERSWYRWANKNEIPLFAVLEERALNEVMPRWDQLKFTWSELSAIPSSWSAALSEWRGIYYIFDQSDKSGYVGSAYGKDNLLGRWKNYALSGHGGNKLLRNRTPENYIFTILQRVSPDMEAEEIIQLESSWKERLHTRTHGLNDN